MNLYPFLFPIDDAQSGVTNPFGQTSPNVGFWGDVASNKAYAALGGIWGAAFIVCAIWLIIGIVKFGKAKRVNHNPDALSDATKSIYTPLIAIACLGGIATIFGAAAGLFA